MCTGLAASFAHSAEIWRAFPQLVPGVLVVDDIRPDIEVGAAAQPWYERARSD